MTAANIAADKASLAAAQLAMKTDRAAIYSAVQAAAQSAGFPGHSGTSMGGNSGNGAGASSGGMGGAGGMGGGASHGGGKHH
jgi:hypothetical protein